MTSKITTESMKSALDHVKTDKEAAHRFHILLSLCVNSDEWQQEQDPTKRLYRLAHWLALAGITGAVAFPDHASVFWRCVGDHARKITLTDPIIQTLEAAGYAESIKNGKQIPGPFIRKEMSAIVFPVTTAAQTIHKNADFLNDFFNGLWDLTSPDQIEKERHEVRWIDDCQIQLKQALSEKTVNRSGWEKEMIQAALQWRHARAAGAEKQKKELQKLSEDPAYQKRKSNSGSSKNTFDQYVRWIFANEIMGGHQEKALQVSLAIADELEKNHWKNQVSLLVDCFEQKHESNVMNSVIIPKKKHQALKNETVSVALKVSALFHGLWQEESSGQSPAVNLKSEDEKGNSADSESKEAEGDSSMADRYQWVSEQLMAWVFKKEAFVWNTLSAQPQSSPGSENKKTGGLSANSDEFKAAYFPYDSKYAKIANDLLFLKAHSYPGALSKTHPFSDPKMSEIRVGLRAQELASLEPGTDDSFSILKTEGAFIPSVALLAGACILGLMKEPSEFLKAQLIDACQTLSKAPDSPDTDSVKKGFQELQVQWLSLTNKVLEWDQLSKEMQRTGILEWSGFKATTTPETNNGVLIQKTESHPMEKMHEALTYLIKIKAVDSNHPRTQTWRQHLEGNIGHVTAQMEVLELQNMLQSVPEGGKQDSVLGEADVVANRKKSRSL